MKLFSYVNAVIQAPRRKYQLKRADGMAVVFMFIINFIFGLEYAFNGITFLVSFLCTFVFLSGLVIGDSYNRKPNIASLMPLTRKQNIVYRFVSVLILFLYILGIMLLAFLAISIVSYLIFVLPYGGDMDMNGADEAAEFVGKQIGVYGGLFSICYFILMYSAGVISGFFTRRKHHNIYLLCVCAAIFVSFELMCLPYSKSSSRPTSVLGINKASPFINASFEAMKLPQLCIAIWFVLAFASLGAAVYLAIRQYKKSSSI